MLQKKLSFLALFTALVLSLSGCGFIRTEYRSVTPHEDPQSHAESETTFSVKNYTELKNALLSLVEQGAKTGTITAYAYPGNVEKDLETARTYILEQYPLGAYAVSALDAQCKEVTSYHQIQLKLTYRHSLAEMDAIQQVFGIANAEEAIGAALSQLQSGVTLRISRYENTNFEALIQQYCFQHPDTVVECPTVAAALYPDSGSTRIVELQFTYTMPQDELRTRLSAVTTIMNSAYGYVHYVEDPTQTAELLYSFLAQRFDYTIGSSATPSYSLLHDGVADCHSLASVYYAMAKRAGLDCYLVTGTHDGQPYSWNILALDGVYYHVDLLRCIQDGRQELSRYLDQEFTDYTWDTAAYPACTGQPIAAQ